MVGRLPSLTRSLPALTAVVAVASACSQVDKVSLQLPRAIQPEFAGFVVPTLNVAGAPTYEADCLQVQVRGGGQNFDPLDELESGKADVALVEGAYAVKRIAEGQALSVIAGYYQRSALVLVGLSKLPSIKDLAFKKVGVWCCGYDLAVRGMFAQAGLPLSTVKFVDEEVTSAVQKLRLGEVDFSSAMLYDELARPQQWLDPQTEFLRQREDLQVYDPTSYSIPALHNLLVVKTSRLSALRPKLVRLLKVVTRTWLFCRGNEDVCAQAFPGNSAQNMWQMREVLRVVFPSPDGLGVVPTAQWHSINDYLVSLGTISASVGDSVINNSIAFEAGALTLDSSTTKAAYTPVALKFCAAYGTEAYRICAGPEHALCAKGYMPTGTAENPSCVQCTPGRFSANTVVPSAAATRMNACGECPAGRYANDPGKSMCTECAPGRFWSSGAKVSMGSRLPVSGDVAKQMLVVGCAECDAGTYSAGRGTSECERCPHGRFSGVHGMTECDRCQSGKYVDNLGKTACGDCPSLTDTAGMGAEHVSECICPSGYVKPSGTHDCERCEMGLLCPVGSNEDTLLAALQNRSMDDGSLVLPRILPGYFAESNAPLSVFLCRNDVDCPGGWPGACGEHARGRACGACEDGYYRHGQKCMSCTGVDESPFNYPILPLILGPFAVLVLYFLHKDKVEKWGNWTNELWSIALLVLMFYQTLGLAASSAVDWSSTVADSLAPFGYLVDLPSMLRLTCSEYTKFEDQYMVNVTAPVVTLAVFVVAFLLAWPLGKCLMCCKNTVEPDSPVGACLKPLKKVNIDVNVFFSLFLAVGKAFYIPVCFFAFQLFMCYEHPNGEESLQFAPEILCFESDWNGMLAEGILALIFYVALVYAIVLFGMLTIPHNFHHEINQRRFKWLFQQFRPDVFWWLPVLLVRALLLVLGLVLSQEGKRQIFWFFAVEVIYGTLLVIFWPWRFRTANAVDGVLCCLAFAFCSLCAWFGGHNTSLDSSVANLAVLVTFTPLCALALLVVYVLWFARAGEAQKWRKLCEAVADEVRHPFMKVVGLDKASAQAFVHRLTEHDRDALRRAVGVIVAELLGHQPGRDGPIQYRVVHREPRTGASTWKESNKPVDQDGEVIWTEEENPVPKWMRAVYG